MTFRYKVRRIARKPMAFGTVIHENDDEILTGVIDGAEASDIEERFARALARDTRVSGFSFREPVISGRNLPGQLEIDFMVSAGPETFAFQVDGEYAHKGMGKKQDDDRKDALVNEYLQQYGIPPIKRIDGELLADQDAANKLVRTLL